MSWSPVVTRVGRIEKDALFSFSAGLLYEALKKQGKRVPEDISIVGYDNYLLNSDLEGKLTTYNVDLVKMARLTVEQVINEIEDPSLAGTIFEVDSNVVKRTSIKELRDNNAE